jgi:hypothetical protein
MGEFVLNLDTSPKAARTRRQRAEAGTTLVKTETLEQLHKISRQADKLAARLELLEPVCQAAFMVLLTDNDIARGQGSQEAHRAAMERMRAAFQETIKS